MKTLITILITCVAWSAASAAAQAVEITDLRCDYLENPLGIDTTKPRLSWKIESSKSDVMQKSYRIQVASSRQFLEQGKADFWDSGVVPSDQSIHVEYAGKELGSRMECFWKVSVVTTAGDAVSAPAKWSMGLLKKEDWQAQWIRRPENRTPDEPTSLPAHYLRKEFSLPSDVRRATAYVCGLGFFELRLNGQKIGDHLMDPAISNYSHRLFYCTFDVTDALRKGENAIGVVLGSGRFYFPSGGKVFGLPMLFLQIEAELNDGTVTRIVSDGTWSFTDQGPIRSNHEFDGETYDARMEMPGWDKPGFNGKNWVPALVVPPLRSKIQAQMMEPIRITRRLRPVSVTPSPNPGAWLVDFGQNFYGNVQLRVRGKAGDEVSMLSAYSLDADGNLFTAPNRKAKCTDTYILKGEGEEEWHPIFVGRGFRRIEVTGFPGKPDASNFEGLVIHNDVSQRGSFECSNPIINQIHQNYLWTARSYLRSVPMDPDRDERQGWNGDPVKAPEAMSWDLGIAPFFAKWHDDHCYDQEPNGLVPSIVPDLGWAKHVDVIWPSTMLHIPETLYLYHGDTSVITRTYDSIKRFVDFGHGLKKDGVIPDAMYSDWCDVTSMAPVRKRGPQNGRSGRYESGATDGGLLSTAYQYQHERIMAQFATLLGKKEDASLYEQQAEATKKAFNDRFLDPATGIYLGSTQTGQCLPLMFDMVPPENRDRVIAALVDDIMVARNGHLSVGMIGTQWLMQTLTKIGRPDVAYVLAAQTTRPSWGYMATKGATSIWERWDTDTGDVAMNSEMLMLLAGNFNSWLYQTLAGINPVPEEPGFKKILIQPQPVGDLTWVKAYHDSPYGRIESNWTREGDRFSLDVVVPPNTTATVVLPDGSSRDVEPGAHAFQCKVKPFVPPLLDLNPSSEKPLAATEGYITAWQISGPHYQGEKAIPGGMLFDTVFPPEKPDQQVAWLFYDTQQTEGPRTLHLGKVFDGFEHATYLRTVLHSSTERTLLVEITTPDRVKLWVRGAPVVMKKNEAGKQVFEVPLVAGDNPLMIKTVQLKFDLDVSVRVLPSGPSGLDGLSARHQ
jgi:alpha-L-rhamnosidase